jgi:ubiquinol-cytochrome c reductase cytochrome c subunit
VVTGHVDALIAVEFVLPAVLALAGAVVPRRGHRRALLFAAVTLAVAASPPLHQWAATSATGHMVQHLMLLVVAAPAVAVGLGGMIRHVPRRLRRALRSRGVLAVAAVSHVVTLGFWHLPRPYDAALDRWWLHLLEHTTLLATAVWWWAAIANHAPRRDPFVAALSLFAVATAGAVVGTVLMFAPALYAHGDLADQQTAGAVMAGTGAVYGTTGLVLVAQAIARWERPGRSGRPGLVHRDEPARRPGSGIVVALAALAAGAVVVLGVLSQPGSTAATPLQAPEPDGEMLYRRDCAACHGPEGAGSSRGVPITDVGPASVQYTLTTGRMPISSPDQPVRRRRPAYTPTEIDAIVNYTRAFVEGPEVPRIDVSDGVARGGELYRLHCAACHSATGIGGAQAFGREAPPVFPASPTEVASVIAVGPGGMPSFRGTFDDPEIAAITDYVELLKNPPTTGLVVPGGRVGEGLVAWLAGIGVLALFVGWIGKRP